MINAILDKNLKFKILNFKVIVGILKKEYTHFFTKKKTIFLPLLCQADSIYPFLYRLTQFRHDGFTVRISRVGLFAACY